MTKEEKSKYIDDLAAKLSESGVFYLTDTAGLDVESINNLRRKCFHSKVELRVVKNTLLKKAMQRFADRNYADLFEALHGPTAVMFSEVGNVPAKLIQEFRRKSDKPVLKGAYIQENTYVGDKNVDMLAALKSKNELVADIILALKSPAQKVISGLTREDRKWPAEN
ncbi:MAG: 50S ribosomal protein L10 [Crocinitomicaceae bacterium]|nr:50S ribosomal protein L10 [Crocinitomicaceae bacterium]MBK8926295.1 50S ribosomal protein L10 [Crocinitomicaceae bacterium]